MTAFKVGDRVHCEFDGEVVDTPAYEKRIVVKTDTGGNFRVSPERLTIAEPAYEAGAMYVDAVGDFFAYWPNGSEDHPWFEPGTSIARSPDGPVRPLRKLVPEQS